MRRSTLATVGLLLVGCGGTPPSLPPAAPVDDLSVYVEGWVVRPGKYVGPTTLGRLVAAAGGISPNAWGSITIIRTLVSGRRIVVAVPVRGKRADLLLEPGDVVRVANGDGD